MKLTKSNLIVGVTPSLITGGGSGALSELTVPDHSLVYTGDNTEPLEFSFGAVTCGYVAVSGHNVAAGEITILDGVTTITTVTTVRTNIIMVTFEPDQVFTDLRVRLDNDENEAITVSYIAAGDFIDVPNGGEQGGYARNWLARPFKNKSAAGKNAAPTAVIRNRAPLKGTLQIANASTVFSRGDWQEFYDYAESSPFFIREVDSLPESTVMAFEPKLEAPKAHGATRALDKLSLKFSVYNGL